MAHCNKSAITFTGVTKKGWGPGVSKFGMSVSDTQYVVRCKSSARWEQTCAPCSPLNTWLLLLMASFVHSFPAKTDSNNLALLLHDYVEHYCLVPHPMAVLGRKRM
jgi:hypothetical protein